MPSSNNTSTSNLYILLHSLPQSRTKRQTLHCLQSIPPCQNIWTPKKSQESSTYPAIAAAASQPPSSPYTNHTPHHPQPQPKPQSSFPASPTPTTTNPSSPRRGGDILLHAGDLTETGSFEEIQSQLTWLSSQPYLHKIVIAGNHDVLLDEDFLQKYPERRYGQNLTLKDLDWGSVQYLRDESIIITLDLTTTTTTTTSTTPKTFTIYGNPQTPQYGISAFQNPRPQDVWSNKIPTNTDIVLTHGPPKLHLDSSNIHGTGCYFLAREIARVRPRLVVFGHIHASYGREDGVVLDGVRRRYEGIMAGWEGWWALGGMVAGVLGGRVMELFRREGKGGGRGTTFVNASVVGGRGNKLRNEPVVVKVWL